MKNKHIILCFGAFLSLVVYIGCTKEPVRPPFVPPFQLTNTAPKVVLQKELSVTIPPDYVFLDASVQDMENNVISMEWKQLSGPAHAIIESPAAQRTKVSSLIPGTYQFEFAAADRLNLAASATTTIVVSAAQTGRELVYHNQDWDCGWGCLIYGLDKSTIPLNTPFLVYIKRDGSNDWVLVPGFDQWSPGSLYYYFVHGQYIDVGVDDAMFPGDTPDVKIVY